MIEQYANEVLNILMSPILSKLFMLYMIIQLMTVKGRIKSVMMMVIANDYACGKSIGNGYNRHKDEINVELKKLDKENKIFDVDKVLNLTKN